MSGNRNDSVPNGQARKKKVHRKGPSPSRREDGTVISVAPAAEHETVPERAVSGDAAVTESNATSAALPSSAVHPEPVSAASAFETVSEAEEKDVEPTLVAYFGHEPVKPSVFLKALRDAKVSRFTGADTSSVETLVDQNDRDGSRLWQLATGALSSDAVSAWIWPFVRNRVNRIVGNRVDLLQTAPAQILRFILIALSAPLSSEEKERGRRAENDLRLAVAWLIEKRNAEPNEVAEELRHLYVDTAGSAERKVRRSLSTGSKVEFIASITALGLGEDHLRRARQERDFERNERFDAVGALEDIKTRSAGYLQTIADLEAEKAELTRLLKEAHTLAESDRRHHAHSSTQTLADFSTSIQRVKGLVEDAGDAVRIAIKRADDNSLRGLQAAERRIAAALDAMTEIGR